MSAETPDSTLILGTAEQQQAQELSMKTSDTGADEAPLIPGYALEKKLGRGSFGEVWAARQSGSGQPVAVKIFSQPRGLDFRYLQHEIKRLRKVTEHPHVVTLLDADFQHEPVYFCMGLYQESLASWRKTRSQVSVVQVVEWFHQISTALKFTHEKGLLHCDLKPANVLLDEEGRAKVADFGQAVEKGLPGSAVGSLGFMAPEQATSSDVTPDVRWDIYGLGATIYFLLTGQAPRLTEESRASLGSVSDPTEKLESYRRALAASPLLPLRDLAPQVDQDLADLVTACLHLDPERRPQSAVEVLEDLRRRSTREPLLCRRPWSVPYRTRRFVSRNLVAMLVACVVVASLATAFHLLAQRVNEMRTDMAEQQFERGWKLAQEGNLAEGAWWWARSLETEWNRPAQAALTTANSALDQELVHGSSPLVQVAWAPGPSRLASVDTEGVLKVWDEGKVAYTLEIPTDASVDAYSLSPTLFTFLGEGQTLLTPRGTFSLIDGAYLREFEGTVMLDASGRGALVQSPQGDFVYWSDSGRETTLDLAGQIPRTVALSPASDQIALVSNEGRVWLLKDGADPKELEHTDVTSLAYSGDGRYLVSCSAGERNARVWEASTGRLKHTLDHQWWVLDARFSPDDRRLVTSLYNGSLRIWDVETGLATLHKPMRHAWFAYGTVGTQGGRSLVSHGVDGRVRVWDATTGDPYSSWLRHGSAVRSIDVETSSGRIATAGQDGKIRIWKMGPARPVVSELALEDGQEIVRVDYDPKGELLAACWQTFPSGGGLKVWPAAQQQGGFEIADHPHAVNHLAFDGSGDRLIWGDAAGSVVVTDRKGTRLQTFQHGSPVVKVGFLPGRQGVFSAGSDGWLRIHGPGGREFRTGSPVEDAQASADGTLIGVACQDGSGLVWECESGEERLRYGHPMLLRRVVFSPDGRRVLFCGKDGVGTLLDLESEARKQFQHDLYMTTGAFSSDGRRLVTVSLDGAVKMWDPATGEPLNSPAGHEGPVVDVRFSPDDSMVLTVSKDGTAGLWDAVSGRPLGLPIQHKRIPYSGAFSPDGRLVLTGGHDGVAKLSEVPLLSDPASRPSPSEVAEQWGLTSLLPELEASGPGPR